MKYCDCPLYAANGRYEDRALPTILLAGGSVAFLRRGKVESQPLRLIRFSGGALGVGQLRRLEYLHGTRPRRVPKSRCSEMLQ